MKKYKEIKKVSIFGIIGNIFLLFLKGTIGLIFKSQSMIADSFNSAGDIFSSIMSLIGNKIANAPADKDHNMGHGKAEYIYSLFIALSMIIVASTLIINSIKVFFSENYFTYSVLLIIGCMITMIVKLILYIYTNSVYKKNNSILVKSLMNDHRNDVFITAISLISILGSFLNLNYIDSIGGIIISLWIVVTGAKIFIESYNVLMDKSIGENIHEKIINVVNSYSSEIKADSISSIPIGSKFLIVLTIFVDGKMSTIKSHEITKEIQKQIKKRFKLIDRVIIHVNPK